MLVNEKPVQTIINRRAEMYRDMFMSDTAKTIGKCFITLIQSAVQKNLIDLNMVGLMSEDDVFGVIEQMVSEASGERKWLQELLGAIDSINPLENGMWERYSLSPMEVVIRLNLLTETRRRYAVHVRGKNTHSLSKQVTIRQWLGGAMMVLEPNKRILKLADPQDRDILFVPTFL